MRRSEKGPEKLTGYGRKTRFIRLCISRRLVIIGRPELEVTIHYVRYWQILEALAESRNYNPDTPLVDYTGGAMTAP